MKIYKEIRLDISSGEVLYENSFEYNGPIEECNGGGGSTTTTIDPAFNAFMAGLYQHNQEFADKAINTYFYGTDYNPYEEITLYVDENGVEKDLKYYETDNLKEGEDKRDPPKWTGSGWTTADGTPLTTRVVTRAEAAGDTAAITVYKDANGVERDLKNYPGGAYYVEEPRTLYKDANGVEKDLKNYPGATPSWNEGVWVDSQGNQIETRVVEGGWVDSKGNPIDTRVTTGLELIQKNTPGAEYDQAAINAQMSLLPSETAAALATNTFTANKAETDTRLLKGYEESTGSGYDLATATNIANLGLVDSRAGLEQSNIDTALLGNTAAQEAINAKRPVTQEFYNQALQGVDVDRRVGQAQTDATMAFQNSGKEMRQQAALAGVNPNSGRFAGALANNSLDQAKAIGSARTSARDSAEQESFARLTTAMGGNA